MNSDTNISEYTKSVIAKGDDGIYMIPEIGRRATGQVVHVFNDETLTLGKIVNHYAEASLNLANTRIALTDEQAKVRKHIDAHESNGKRLGKALKAFCEKHDVDASALAAFVKDINDDLDYMNIEVESTWSVVVRFQIVGTQEVIVTASSEGSAIEKAIDEFNIDQVDIQDWFDKHDLTIDEIAED